MNTQSFSLALVAAAGLLAPMALAHAEPDTRIVVKTADDLPRHTYVVKGKALDILKDEAQFNALLDQAIADANADLAKYKIEDPAALRGYYDFLQTAASLKGEWDKAIELTAKLRELETKESEKLMRGQGLQARVAAMKAAGDDKDKFVKVFKTELKSRIEKLPYSVVKDRLIAVRNQAKIVSRQLVESSLSNQMDPIIEANKGTVPQEIIIGLVNNKFALDLGLPLLPAIAEVYGEVIDANVAAKSAPEVDLWTPRLVTLPTSAPAKPVVVAVWDSGVDTNLYPGQLWTNPHEQANGKDDDGNGFVDDLHGIAWGKDHKPTPGPLGSLAALNGSKDELLGYVSASQDMQTGIESPEVDAFRKKYASLTGESLREFTDDLGLIGQYAHGTHVAGITVAGNPFARLVHVTENWPSKSIPETAPTIEEYRQWGLAAEQTVDYLQKANVRVVNMSWRIPRAAVEGMLEAKGVGGSSAERAELSRKIFKEFHDGLENAIKNAPDILFIAGAGNEDNDLDFSEYVPAGLKLPNLITVGAVDQKDKPTSFTSTGKGVDLYSNGYRIESFLPGGQKVKFSGTSMAAPQVANLAAKILALKPDLKPADVLALIRQNADPLPDQPGRFIINPKKTIDALGIK